MARQRMGLPGAAAGAMAHPPMHRACCARQHPVQVVLAAAGRNPCMESILVNLLAGSGDNTASQRVAASITQTAVCEGGSTESAAFSAWTRAAATDRSSCQVLSKALLTGACKAAEAWTVLC